MPNDQMVVDEAGELRFSPTTVLEPFASFELCEGKDALFMHRLRIEEALALLKEYRDKLDEELVRVMREEGIEEFNSEMRGRPTKVFFANEKKEEVVASRRLINMLHGNEGDDAREMAFAALSTAKTGVWKVSKLRELADTKGIDRKDLIKTSYGDRIKVQAVDVEAIERAKQ